MRRLLSNANSGEVTEQLIGMMDKAETNKEFLERLKRWISLYERGGYSSGGSGFDR